MSVKQDIIDNRVNMDDVISCVSKHMNGNDNIHGLSHCQRVERNAIRLQHPGVNMTVARLFAYFHDACRSECKIQSESEHGLLASELVMSLRNSLLKDLSDYEIEMLSTACKLHTTTFKTGNPTIDTCFDADRLDLWRVFVKPDPEKMATSIGAELAKDINAIISDEAMRYRSNEKLLFSPKPIEYGDNVHVDYGFRISSMNPLDMMACVPWNFCAKSFCANARGVAFVRDSNFRIGADFFFRQLIAICEDANDIRFIKLEYATEDVVYEPNILEAAIRQGNILETMTIKQFILYCQSQRCYDIDYIIKSIKDSLICQRYFKKRNKSCWVENMAKGFCEMDSQLNKHLAYMGCELISGVDYHKMASGLFDCFAFREQIK